MREVVISGTGLYVPPYKISNDELVQAFNTYVDQFNAENAAAIESGTIAKLVYSSSEFIEKAAGIKQRYVMNKTGLLDPHNLVVEQLYTEYPYLTFLSRQYLYQM